MERSRSRGTTPRTFVSTFPSETELHTGIIHGPTYVLIKTATRPSIWRSSSLLELKEGNLDLCGGSSILDPKPLRRRLMGRHFFFGTKLIISRAHRQIVLALMANHISSLSGMEVLYCRWFKWTVSLSYESNTWLKTLDCIDHGEGSLSDP